MLVSILLMISVGCRGELEAPTGRNDPGSNRPDAGSAAGDAGAAELDSGTQPDPAPPAAAPVRFKGGARLRTDWARGLELEPSEVCKELGRYDCVLEVHRIVLGGVEPYVLNINRPLSQAPVTAPLAVERTAIAACGRAVERDFAEPEAAVVFVPEADGTWTVRARRATHVRLIEGLLKRRAEPTELDRLEELWSQSADPEEWAQSSCFVVATSLESLFY